MQYSRSCQAQPIRIFNEKKRFSPRVRLWTCLWRRAEACGVLSTFQPIFQYQQMSKPKFVYFGLQTSCSVSNRRTTTSAALSRRLSTLKYCHLNYPSSTCPPAYASPQWSAPQVTTLHWRTRWNACSSAPPCRPQPSRQTSSWGRAPGWTPFSQEQPQRPFSQPQKLSRLYALPRCLRSNLQRCKQARGWSGDALGLATCLTRDPNPINKSSEENKRKSTKLSK